MKFYLLSNNIDTQMGIRLTGIEGVVVHGRHEALGELECMMHMEDIITILMATKLTETCPKIISGLKLEQKKPLIIEIPDRHGSTKVRGTINRYVSKAIDVEL